MVSEKNQIMKESNDDMELNICLIGEKMQQKSKEYQDDKKQQDNHLHQAKERYKSVEQREVLGKKNEVHTCSQRMDQILYLKQRTKDADKELFEIRAQRDHENVLEKNRMKLLREKKNELSKWIDFEKYGRSMVKQQANKSTTSTPKSKYDPFNKLQRGVLGKKKENHEPIAAANASKSPRVDGMEIS